MGLRSQTFLLVLSILAAISQYEIAGFNYLPISTRIRLLPFQQQPQNFYYPQGQMRQDQPQQYPFMPPTHSESFDESPSKIFNFPPPRPSPLLHQIQSGYYNELFVIPGDGKVFPWHIIQVNKPWGLMDQSPGDPSKVALSGQIGSVEDPDEFDESEGFGLRENVCSHFSHEGRCYKQNQCLQKKGRLTNYCRDFSKFCCIFYVKCGEETNEEALYFRNSDWPGNSVQRGACGITITKKSNDFCYVRISPKNLRLPDEAACAQVAFEAKVSGKSYASLCGKLSGKSYVIDMSSVNGIQLQVRTDLTASLIWEIGVTQLPCSDSPGGEMWPEKGSQTGSVSGGSTPPKKKPEVEQPVEQVKNPSQNVARRCGKPAKKYLPKQESSLSGFASFQSDVEGALKVTPVLEEEELRVEDQTIYNPELSTLDWHVERPQDSLLYNYAFDRPPILSGRITFGQKTKPHQYPWSVAMYSNGRYHCGGSLISKKHILTAAHCVVRYKSRPSALTFTIGEWNINSKTSSGIRARAARVSFHPSYSKVTLKYDVAVVTLQSEVPLSDEIIPVCFADPGLEVVGKVVTVTGWGRNQQNKLQSVLMEHSAAVLSQRECNKRWRLKGAPDGIIADTMLCMDPQYGDSCKGDSGGPSVWENPPGSGNYIQVGIVSFGSASCVDKKLPGVYTKVSKVSAWIKQQMV